MTVKELYGEDVLKERQQRLRGRPCCLFSEKNVESVMSSGLRNRLLNVRLVVEKLVW